LIGPPQKKKKQNINFGGSPPPIPPFHTTSHWLHGNSIPTIGNKIGMMKAINKFKVKVILFIYFFDVEYLL
jgi:hypothetical protein